MHFSFPSLLLLNFKRPGRLSRRSADMHFRSSSQSLWLSPRKFIHTLLAVSSLTAIVSTLALAFKADASSSYHDSRGGGAFYGPDVTLRPDIENGGFQLWMYPAFLKHGSIKPTLAGFSISLALALSVIGMCVFVYRGGKALLLSDLQRHILFMLLGGECILNLVMFVICLVQRLRSDKFDPSYDSLLYNKKNGPLLGAYDGGTFDLGSWSCQMQTYLVLDYNSNILVRQCTDETAALWTGLLVALLSSGMGGLIYMDWRGQRALIRHSRAVDVDMEDDFL
nr:hypothetical protein CFP56_26025 [Quercus suber]